MSRLHWVLLLVGVPAIALAVMGYPVGALGSWLCHGDGNPGTVGFVMHHRLRSQEVFCHVSWHDMDTVRVPLGLRARSWLWLAR